MNNRRPGGFALPTVLIASIIMMAVLLSAVSSTAAVRVSVREQYFNQLARNAADAGMTYAKSCLSNSAGIATWSDANPLKPGTDCSGAQISGYNCTTTPTDSRCVMTYGNNVLSSFSVGTPESSIRGWSVNDDKNIETFSGGLIHTCGISFSGKLYCWGSGANGELGNSTISRNTLSPSAVKTSIKFKSVSAGSYHTCGIGYDGNGYCWGLRTSGQLGDGSSSGQTSEPVAINTTNLTGNKKIKMISSGDSHTCAVGTDNKVYCWGLNNYGQLGNANTGTNSSIPVAVSTAGVLSGKSIISISSGAFSTCVVATSGASGTTTAVYCWGSNSYGQLGNANTGTDSNIPVAVSVSGPLASKTVTQIASGYYSVCVLAGSVSSDLSVYCWGNNANGQLGNGSTTDSNVPTAVVTSGALSGLTVSNIGSGNAHVCAIASDGKLYCWGNNMNGQLGDGTLVQKSSPQQVPSSSTSDLLYGKTILAVNGGQGTTCAVTSDSAMYCWGNDNSNSGADTGMLGDNDSTDKTSPVAVYTNEMAERQTIKLSSKGYTNILRASDSSVWQSYNAYSKYEYPNRVWKQVSSGLRHQCGLTNDSQIYCWGDNTFGQLGDGTNIDRSSPTSVYAGTSSSPGVLYGKTFLSVQSSERFTCALSTDYNVYCWGDNTEGEIGNGSSVSYSNVPVAVSKTAYSSKPVISMSVGRFKTCVIVSTLQVYCWGRNDNGELGNNSSATSNVPVAVYTTGVLSGLSILSISSGSNHTCVVASDNNSYCWGLGSSGQLGNAASATSIVPVAVNTAGVLSGKEVMYLSTGYMDNFVIGSDGVTYGWGSDTYGELGNNDSLAASNVPVALNTTNIGTKSIGSIAVGFQYACALTVDSSVYCWGRNFYASLGESTLLDQAIPVTTNISNISSGSSLSSVASSAFGLTTCSLATDTQTYCWGGGIMSNGLFDPDYYGTKTSSNILIPINQPGARIF